MILVYAFSNQWGTNVSRLTAVALAKEVRVDVNKNIDIKIINGHPKPFFEKHIKNNHYDLIIGLGDGSKFINKIKIETQAKNNYLNKTIVPYSPISLELSLPIIDLYDPSCFFISDNMGNYNCNYLAYLIQHEINNKSPTTQQLFFHLPLRQNAINIAKNISEILINNNLL